jgi:hypothetical protein
MKKKRRKDGVKKKKVWYTIKESRVEKSRKRVIECDKKRGMTYENSKKEPLRAGRKRVKDGNVCE